MLIHVGLSRNKRIKFTDCRDCLSPDIREYKQQRILEVGDLLLQIPALELAGFDVCIDITSCYYETGTRQLGAA